jgi:hypothetical protein
MNNEMYAPDHKFTDEEIVSIIQKEMPGWITACSRADADHVISDQLAFGNSTEELLLMAIAIKYAKLQGKAVMISAGQQ